MKPITRRKIEDYDFNKTLHCIDFIICYSDITKVGEHHLCINSSARMRDVVALRFKGFDVKGIASRIRNLHVSHSGLGVSHSALYILCKQEVVRLLRKIDGKVAPANWIAGVSSQVRVELIRACKSIAAS